MDLVPIKPLPNVVTLQEDITTERCRQVIGTFFSVLYADTRVSPSHHPNPPEASFFSLTRLAQCLRSLYDKARDSLRLHSRLYLIRSEVFGIGRSAERLLKSFPMGSLVDCELREDRCVFVVFQSSYLLCLARDLAHCGRSANERVDK